MFVLVYKEIELAIQLGSEYAVNILKHPNIVVSLHTHTHTLTAVDLRTY